MAIYPATLPPPLVSGYQLSPADQTVRSDMEVGMARVRRRTSARDDQVGISLKLSDAQMAIFRAWFEGTGTDDANGGTAWISQLPLALGTGGLTTPDCRFVGPYTATPISGTLNWAVTAKLEVR